MELILRSICVKLVLMFIFYVYVNCYFFLYGKNVIVNLFVLDIDILKCIFYEYVRFVSIKNFIFIYLFLFVFILYLL